MDVDQGQHQAGHYDQQQLLDGFLQGHSILLAEGGVLAGFADEQYCIK
jgi:hypothetical protein